MKKFIEKLLDVVLTSIIIGTIAGVLCSVLVKPFMDILFEMAVIQMEVTYTQLAIIFSIGGFITTIPKVIKYIEEA